VSLTKLLEASTFIASRLDHTLTSKYFQAARPTARKAEL
jgi:hypothetical protein